MIYGKECMKEVCLSIWFLSIWSGHVSWSDWLIQCAQVGYLSIMFVLNCWNLSFYIQLYKSLRALPKKRKREKLIQPSFLLFPKPCASPSLVLRSRVPWSTASYYNPYQPPGMHSSINFYECLPLTISETQNHGWWQRWTEDGSIAMLGRPFPGGRA